jgi:FkbM family methyltransferase
MRIHDRRGRSSKNGSSSYQVSIAFFLGSAFGLLLSEMKHGLISGFSDVYSQSQQPGIMITSQLSATKKTKDLSTSPSTSDWIVPECTELFSEVKNGTLEDPNYTDERMIENALHSRFTVDEPRFHISLHNPEYDVARWSIMEYGKYYETGVTENFQKVFREHPGGILVDVGMNIGWFSLWGLANGAEIFAFEPNPMNRLRFCESAKLNQYSPSSIHLYSDALSDKSGDLVLTHKQGEPGAAKLMEADSAAKMSHLLTHQIKLSRLDDIAQGQGWLTDNSLTIALLKVDVEGHDAQVIFGAKELLRSGRVENLFMEYSCSSSISETVDEMKQVGIQLMESGYTVHEIGNWRGAPKEDAHQAVMGEDTQGKGNLAERLYKFCRHEDETKRGAAQLNVWWKKLA